MNWEEVVQVISELVKDGDIRRQIYDRMFETCDFDKDEIYAAQDIDRVFDDLSKEYVDFEDDDIFEEDEDYDRDED